MQGGVWIYHDYVCMRNGIPVALPVHDVFAENTLDESPGDRVGCDLKREGKTRKSFQAALDAQKIGLCSDKQHYMNVCRKVEV